MTSKNLQENMRLLLSYGRSITRTSEALGINRQQIHRYLNGENRPSLRTMHKICDYFGVEESEILLDPEAVNAGVKLHRFPE